MLNTRHASLLLVMNLLTHMSVFAADEPVKFPLPAPSSIGDEKYAQLLNKFISEGGYEKWQRDLKPRATGPYFVHDSGVVESLGTHGPSAVKVYYSDEVWKWMKNGRKGLIPDGGMIIKVLYARNPKEPTKFSEDPTGFSIMVKDSKGSWDGWFYSDGGPLQKPTHEHAASFFDPNAGFALSCINCHASADNVEGTYSALRNITDQPIEHITKISPEGLKKGLAIGADVHSIHEKDSSPPRPPKQPSPHWNGLKNDAKLKDLNSFPHAMLDHVPQGPRPDGHRPFITSSNCQACHDATQLYSVTPNMALKLEPKPGETSFINLSPNGEWRYSMMALSGRDPVFFAQLESERALHPELADQIDNKCLSCHAVMGQRQWKMDRGDGALFTHQMALAEPGSQHDRYGALSRDGVSCVICHQMLPEGLGKPDTYGGKFKLDPKPNFVFGPYEKAATLPMEQAIGLTPKQGVHISDSKLCASCHAIPLPILDVGKKYSPEEFNKLASDPDPSHSAHEQATYLEWKNSNFSTEKAAAGATKKSCQDCHMPRSYNGENLRFKIANIEDDTFPPVDNRAPNEKLKLEPRDRYSRHALHGINLFMTEMFKQNPETLGVSPRNNLFPNAKVKSGFDVAIQSALQMAQEQTATLKIMNVKRTGNRLTAQVQITNLTGHKFPTGVNFRRAFIDFKVQAGEKTVWQSGATDEWGVIGNFENGKFTPLKTEFFKDKQYQPHHQKIEREDQVQIYEELVADSDGKITNSFLSLKTRLKDNRLQPQGWAPGSPDAEHIGSVGVGDDKDYQIGDGREVTAYDIPIDTPAGQPLSLTATLYYQALPPFYLQQRFEHLDRPASQRLFNLVNAMDLTNTAVGDWKLKISQDRTEAQ